MSLRSSIRVQKLQNKNKMMALGTCKANERRAKPWLGSYWFTEATEEEREEYIKRYDEETKQLIKKGYKLI